MSKIISFDQASVVTGYAIFDDGKYIESGVIKKSKDIPIADRVPAMALAICAKIKEVKPDHVVIEDIQNQNSVKTVIDLARLQGGIIMYCANKHIPIHIYHPSTWRRELGFVQGTKTKRDALKEQATEYVKGLGFEIESEDESEAICINLAAQQMI
jgi:Holliday junction resolvasome RuvABC endonuclease subunit